MIELGLPTRFARVGLCRSSLFARPCAKFRYAHFTGSAASPPCCPSLSLRGLRPLLDQIKAKNKKLRIPFIFAIGIDLLQDTTAQNRNTGRCAQGPAIALKKLTLGKKEAGKNKGRNQLALQIG